MIKPLLKIFCHFILMLDRNGSAVAIGSDLQSVNMVSFAWTEFYGLNFCVKNIELTSSSS